ncbi:hypothetical protein ANCCEY_04402 [Ancylostoma ceylanicum]|uniref:NTR domain-containing protein n=1 Tax=Ancylostoma ceylanicum TaxID=53326 RepID=A0A0D6M9H2_9BILA|nr:hypothetical protein ANCCEY_04402 [Ancylostoma ceylanicum]
MCVTNTSSVLMARVLSIDSRRSPYGANTVNTTNDGTWKYTIWHMQTWKGPMAATSALTTPYSEDNCGVHGLIKDVDYFLTGKKGKNGEVTFTSCDFVGPYSQLTTQEYYLLMELAWDSRQCKDIVGDKNVKEDGSIGSIVKESEERSVEEYDGESDEEEDSEEYDEDNGGETVEDNGEDPMEKKDEKPAHNSNSNTVD